MFTGLIQAVGKIASLERRGEDVRVKIATGQLSLEGVNLGDSIAVSGVCLTAVELGEDFFAADVSGETLSRTVFGALKTGDAVNLEKSLTLATPLGGHLVSGHVDGVGRIVDRWDDGRSVRFRIQSPDELARYIAEKGSICVDGISLTVNRVEGAAFELNIVPHTLQVTTMAAFKQGRRVNLEVDLIARYLERLMLGGQAGRTDSQGISEAFLAQHGFKV